MSTPDNNSHKEEKTDRSAMKKQSEMEERESGNSEFEELEDSLRNLNIQDSTVPSDRKDIRVKFLINVPMGVTREMSKNAESHCQKFLDLLKRRAFREEDTFHFKDIAVVFGLNGKESDREAVETEFQKQIDSDIAFEKFTFEWPESTGIPYRRIREEIKNSKHTKQTVEQFKTKDPNDPIYFCFFDADVVDFNHVLSSYIDVIEEHNYPTVMSTGYLFPEDSDPKEKSKHDRQVRIITAEHFPLGTYYPEPNFCVRLSDESDTLSESFDKAPDTKHNMESPILIRQVKTRPDFKAVFADKNPVIIPVPNKKQLHTNLRTWAISAYAHKTFKITERYKMETFGEEYKKDRRVANGVHKRLLINLLKSDKSPLENASHFEGPGVDQLLKAAKAVREYLRKIKQEKHDARLESDIIHTDLSDDFYACLIIKTMAQVCC